ncbi:MAG: metal-transporting ATPase, partial [Halobacteriota archaeon]
TETIRLLLFISLSILIFDFYPVTAIMVVLLAILNDIPIMAIAFDNVPTPDRPVRWEMRNVLSLALVLGIAGVFSSFLLFWYVERVMQFSAEMVQTFMFLKLLVAGHMTIFLTRNKGAMWQKPYPSLTLFGALEATQVLGTLIAVYGFLVYPIGWVYALIIWGYALMWLSILNGVKLISFRN